MLIHKVCLCTLTLQEYLLKQGNVEQSPVAFMNQETSDSRLLVIINNKDIAGHVHKVRLNGQSNGSTVVQVDKTLYDCQTSLHRLGERALYLLG